MSVRLALLWHFHQPCYLRPEASAPPALPWVRMHALRGYTDMVDALERHPRIRCTLNWVPVLVQQLQRIADGECDEWLRRARARPADWSVEDLAFLRPRLAARPTTRRHRQADRARRARLEAAEARGRLAEADRADLLDEVMRFHLDWSGARLRRDRRLRQLALGSGGFSVEDRRFLLERQHREIEELLPRVRALAERGGVEMSCTPEHHPILPLVDGLDSRDFPHADDGGEPFRHEWPEDAAAQVRRGAASHREAFGDDPQGMWPAEGAVSPRAAAHLAREGLCWIASDEAILFASLGREDRDALYRPARLSTEGGALSLLFRDRDLSDRIGFQYSRMGARRAVDDFVARLEEIGRDHPGATVSVILDGENPWEHFRGAGRPFLDELYRRLAEHPSIETRTASEAVLGAREQTPLDTLATGSWIRGNLDTWAGHPEKLAAWRRLSAVRAAAPPRLEDAPEAAARSLRVLQSSDWFWWLGDDHPSALSGEFDRLFSEHLIAAARALGLEPPSDLPEGLRGVGPARPLRLPRDWLAPRGAPGDVLQWLGAGELRPLAPGGAMSEGDWPRRVWYGFEPDSAGRCAVLHVAWRPSSDGVQLYVDGVAQRAGGTTGTPEGPARHVRCTLDAAASAPLRLRFQSSRGRWPNPDELLLQRPPRDGAGEWWMV